MVLKSGFMRQAREWKMRRINNGGLNVVIVPDDTPVTKIPDLPNVNAKRGKRKSYLIDDDAGERSGGLSCRFLKKWGEVKKNGEG